MEIFDEVREMQTRAAIIASLSLSIIDWPLTKNKAKEQIRMFRIESCAQEQI